jgi:pimeloyl-ACP methyl ester carboxylesterase
VCSLVAYRATDEARRALVSDDDVTVTRRESSWEFVPSGGANRPRVGLVFFAGALVDPVAYAPLARAAAAEGYPAVLVELPWRGAFGGADRPEALSRARTAMQRVPVAHGWVAAGHSRGAAVAARLVYTDPRDIVGLVLIASSHPRDFSLAATTMPVTKIYGTRDGLASVDEVEANHDKLPEATRWIPIAGGNHSQFGWYGFQPGDRPAAIDREFQQAQTIAAVLKALDEAAARAEAQ